MATALLHPAFDGISGKSGGLVFRQTRNGIVVARRPDALRHQTSPAQQAQRDRFALATAYARRVLADPLQRRDYERLAAERNRRVDKLVMSDFLTPPVVEDVDVSGYQGQPGDLIRVLATDDIEVIAVDVTIQDAAGAVMEQGPAAKRHGVWDYTATAIAPNAGTFIITAAASDRAGNIARRSLQYNPVSQHATG